MRLLRWIPVLLAAGLMLACAPKADTSRPVATALQPAAERAQRLVVVLPGRRDDLESLKRSGVGDAIQAAWPDADVLFAELGMAYYLDRSATHRLHREVLAPMRARGYSKIWLVGASLGGMGGILYDRDYPGQVDGMLLLAPYLGEPPIHDEIRAAGGVAAWNPDAIAVASRHDWQRDLWRHLKSWAASGGRRDVWLAYGEGDYLRDSMPLIAQLLPAEHVQVHDGGHAWSVWTPATALALRSIEARQAAAAATR